MASRLPDDEWVAQFRAALSAVTAAYRAGDYVTALARTDGLKDGSLKTAPHCFFRGGMLRYLGRFDEAELSLREGVFLERDAHRRALALSTLAAVLMHQERFQEAITAYEAASRAWPDSGASLRGIAQVRLWQGLEFPESLKQARQAVELDRRATGMPKEALDHRLGEDLAVLAWAQAANAADTAEVESTLNEAFRLCATSAKAILAEVHYNAGRAYRVLENESAGREHFRQAAEIDPHGIFGLMARSTRL